MRLYIRLLLAFFFFNVPLIFAQNGLDIILTPPAGIQFSNIAATSDQGFILCGNSFNSIDSTTDFYIAKYTAAGVFQWSTTLADSAMDEIASEIIQTYDGNYIFIGSVKDKQSTFYDYCHFSKLDSSGNVLWIKHEYGTVYAFGEDIINSLDSGYIIRYHEDQGTGNHVSNIRRYSKMDMLLYESPAGFLPYPVNHNTATNTNFHLFSIALACDYCFNSTILNQPLVRSFSPSGTLLWEHAFTPRLSNRQCFGSICATDSNGMMVCGAIAKTASDTAISLIYMSPIGDSLWAKTYGKSTQTELAFDIQLCADKGYIVSGIINTNCPTSDKIFLFKLNQNADSIWFKTFQGLTTTNYIRKVIQTAQGGYLIFGSDFTGTSYRIIKTDVNGDIDPMYPYSISTSIVCPNYCVGDTAWLSVYPPALSYQWSTGDTIPSIPVTVSGSYSATLSNSQGQSFNTTGFQVNFNICTTLDEDNYEEITILPNPFNESIKVLVEQQLENSLQIEIIDLTGRIVFMQSQSKSNEEINLSFLKKGIYILKLNSKGHIQFTKVIKL